ncbi:MAG TPA: hypothetical protein G4O13_04020 [Dehalococcoidia bacterium]|nr:hypothetical protein [Dehalococcoidia bacterium]
MRKILAIGLDAVCLDILSPWVSQGHLPSIENLLNKGVYSELRSTIPPWTAPAWTSLVTGKNPGKHGIFDFFKRGNEYESSLVSSRDNKAKAIWDYLSAAGKKVIVINVPITNPAVKVNGILIPGYLATEPPTCHPPHILEEINEALGEYRVYSKYDSQPAPSKKKLRGFLEVTALRTEAAIYLGSKYDWNFLMVEYQKTDGVFHECRKEEHILEFFKFIDQCIGRLVETLGIDANIFLFSDHGIGKCDWVFAINSWLEKEGLLKAKGVGKMVRSLEQEKQRLIGCEGSPYQLNLAYALMGYLGKLGVSIENIDKLLSLLHLEFPKRIAPHGLIDKVPQRIVDEVNSMAYCPSPSSLGIRINAKACEEYQTFRSQLIEKLISLEDLEGNPVFETVLPREECYYGPNMADAPDIVFIPREMNHFVTALILNKIFSPNNKYNHKMNGFFFAQGEDIRSDGHLGSTLSIYDVAPTILHAMGMPIPRDMDGRVLTEIFKEGTEPARREIIYQETEAEDEKERIKRQVKELKSPGDIS